MVESDFSDWWTANKKKNRALEAAAVYILRDGTREPGKITGTKFRRHIERLRVFEQGFFSFNY